MFLVSLLLGRGGGVRVVALVEDELFHLNRHGKENVCTRRVCLSVFGERKGVRVFKCFMFRGRGRYRLVFLFMKKRVVEKRVQS